MTKSRFLTKREKSFSSNKVKSADSGIVYIEKTSRPHWMELLAYFSQVVMLIIVGYGYFYTVKPVFQKEQIAEKLAKLEIEEQRWDEKLADMKNELDEKQLALAKLNTQTEVTLNELQSYKQERDIVLSSLEIKSSELETLNKKLTSANQAIKAAKENIAGQIENQILGIDALSNSYLSVLDKYIKTFELTDETRESGWPVIYRLWSPEHNDYTHSFIQSFKQISPFAVLDILADEIQGKIKQSSGIEKEALKIIYKKYEFAKNNKRKELSCPALPLDEWTATYSSLDKILDESTNKCVIKTIKKAKETNNYSEQFPHTDYYTSVCKNNINSELINLMQDKWSKVLTPCKERVLGINEIVLKDIKEEQLTPFGDLRPPSNELITSHINNYVERNVFFKFKNE